MGTDHSIVKPIIFFDGVCNLCNSSVQFIIKRDKQHKFLFASLQSAYAQENLPENLYEKADFKSIILKTGDNIKTKSTAILTITKYMSGLWPLVSIFLILPKFVRDGVYDMVARNRYKWFGKEDACMIPSVELKSKFLD